jgi:hypothetical protein
MPLIRLIWTMNPVPINLTRLDAGHKPMPNLIRAFREFHTGLLRQFGSIEKAQFDLRGIGGKNGKVRAILFQGDAERMRQAGAYGVGVTHVFESCEANRML